MTKTRKICNSLAIEQARARRALGRAYGPPPQQLADAIDGYRDVIAIRLERIKDLGKPKEPPHEYVATLRAYVRQLDRARAAIPAQGIDAKPPDPGPVEAILRRHQPQLVRLASAYGMHRCRALDAKSLPRPRR